MHSKLSFKNPKENTTYYLQDLSTDVRISLKRTLKKQDVHIQIELK